MESLIDIRNVTKAYEMGDQTVKALDGVDLVIKHGEYVAIIGPSGSGKSTLMNIIGCLDTPTHGSYILNGQDVSQLKSNQLADARNKNIGFIFQRFNLLGRVSALRNVEMPARYAGMTTQQRRDQAVSAMNAVGLGNRLTHKPVELSGGQQQRVAIARALINQPNLLLADEPTGALDTKTGQEILSLFSRLHAERGITVIVVTHDANVASHAHRVISIRDGKIESDRLTQTAQKNNVPASEQLSLGLEPRLVLADAAPVSTAPELTVATPQHPNISLGRVGLFGLIAVLLSVLANFGVRTVAVNAFALPAFGGLSLATPLIFTAVGVGLAVLVFALLSRSAKNPVRTFSVLAFLALLLSFVPLGLYATGNLNATNILGANTNRRTQQSASANPAGAQTNPQNQNADAGAAADATQTRGQFGRNRNAAESRLPTALALGIMHVVAYVIVFFAMTKVAVTKSKKI